VTLAFNRVRRRARELANELTGSSLWPAIRLVSALAEKEGLEISAVPPTDSLLAGARAVLEPPIAEILHANDVSPEDLPLLLAHELGHHFLHAESEACDTSDLEFGSPSHPAPLGEGRLLAYGPRERRELEANVFARELLLPGPFIQEAILNGRTASAIAAETQVPLPVVLVQLADAMLLPEDTAPPESPKALPPPDPSQKRAANTTSRFHLVVAGPGTGKTRTLVERANVLVGGGVAPKNLLVLTFSNRAAREVGRRLESLSEDYGSAPATWTFHGFGLEILRKYYDRLGLQPDFKLLDPTDAVELMEERLPVLGLRHYQNLYEPALSLSTVFSAISRAKDEAVDAAQYDQLVDGMGRADEAVEKAREIALVYNEYSRVLREANAVDFGDLMLLPLKLMEQDTSARESIRELYPHILVDEYQDVNRAGARLLREITGPCGSLWAVGDPQQSIYRFRGACPENIANFQADFPGATFDGLEVSYRSTPEVIGVINTFSRSMGVQGPGGAGYLRADRVSSGSNPSLVTCADDDDELEAIAREIQRLETCGVPMRHQAVLCRSNRRLADVTNALEARGIPVLQFGSLFEREEIRMLLTVLELVAGRSLEPLVRVGTLPEYSLPLEDVEALLDSTGEHDARGVLANPATVCSVSSAASAGLARLHADLGTLRNTSTPWFALATYLFDGSQFFQRHLHGAGPDAVVRRIAVHRLLSFLHHPLPPRKGLPILRMLERIRRLVMLSHEGDLRSFPAGAESLDAVRLMTIHGAKGLEFEAVHLPGLTKASLPASRQGARWPMVPGLVELRRDPKQAHKHEEQCLFHVASSRTRTHLTLYRSGRRSAGARQNRTASPFLEPISFLLSDRLPTHRGGRSALVRSPHAAVRRPSIPAVSAKGLQAYEMCPRKFLYEHELELRGSSPRTAFGTLTRCIAQVRQGVQAARHTSPLSESDVWRLAKDVWERSRLSNHPFAVEYRALLDQIMHQLLAIGFHDSSTTAPTLEAVIHGVSVHVSPDQVLHDGSGLVLRKFRYSTMRKTAKKTAWWDLASLVATESVPGRHRLELVYLLDGQIREIHGRPDTARKHIQAVENARAEGHMPALGQTKECARCRFFFMCPSVPALRDDLSL